MIERSVSKVLVTGANGFVGKALCRHLEALGISNVKVVRQRAETDQVAIGTMTRDTDWTAVLSGCDTVVHLAARVHVMDDVAADPMAEYHATNVDATLGLAAQAAQAGVKRFLFLSSVKVNGEATHGSPFKASDQPRPADPYGITKLEAERGLWALAESTGLEVVVIRPPLVVGPGVGANFRKLMQLVASGMPLPLASVSNRRSMVGLDNLVDLLITCLSHPRAPGQVLMVSDDHDLSTPDLVKLIAAAMRKRPRLLPFPVGVMHGLASIVGKAAVVDRLAGSLQVDVGPTKEILGWRPPFTPQDSVRQAVEYYLQHV